MTTTVNTEQHDSGAFLVWDRCEITEAHARYLREEDPELSEDEASDHAYEDPNLLGDEWDFLVTCLSDKMEEINPDGCWKCSGSGMGWQHRSGHKTFQAQTGQALLDAILPNTACTFSLFIDGEGDAQTFRIVNSHHDAMGEVYEIAPEEKAPCGCTLTECDPDTDTEKEERFCRNCAEVLPEGYELPEED